MNFIAKVFRNYSKITLVETDIVEKFVKGGGKGGQKINKTNSAVQLLHLPTGIRVCTQKYRSLSDNRREARKLLTKELDFLENGTESKKMKEISKIQKNKAKALKRTRDKDGSDDTDGANATDGTDEEKTSSL